MQWHNAEFVGQRATIETPASVEICLNRAISACLDAVMNMVGGVIYHKEPSQILVLLKRKISLRISEGLSVSVQSLDAANDHSMRQWFTSICVHNFSLGRWRHQLAMWKDDATGDKRRQNREHSQRKRCSH